MVLQDPGPHMRPTSRGLAGREGEFGAIRSAIEAFSASSGTILISGEAGVGKSALVRAVMEDHDGASVQVSIRGAATPPYGPVADLLRALMRSRPDLVQTCAGRLAPLAAIVPELGDGSAAGDAGGVAAALSCALGAFARSSGAPTGPAIVVLDDLQWADRATLELFPVLENALVGLPVVLIGTYRSDEIGRQHALRRTRVDLRRTGRLTEVALAPLDRVASTELVRRLLGGDADDALTAALYERSDGLPFFLEELAHVILEAGRGIDGTELPLPETVRDAVLLRLDGLDANARRLAGFCSVLGMRFSWSAVAALAGDESGIDALFEAGIIVESGQDEATFRHALVQEGVYGALAWTVRRDRHRSAAEYLEAQGASAGLVAWHWQRGREPTRARDAFVRAMEEAAAISAYRDAFEAGRQALDLWTDEADAGARLDLLDRMAPCAQAAGLLQEAAQVWRDAAAERERSGDTVAYAETLSRLAACYGLQGSWGQAIEARERAARAYATAGRPLGAAEERLVLAAHLHGAASFTATHEVLVAAEQDARAAGREDLVARVLALRGANQSKLGAAQEGIALVHEALELALRGGHMAAAAEIYQRLASAIEHSSDYGAAEDAYVAARTFCEAQGMRGGVQYCNACVAGVLWHRGEWDRMVDLCQEVLADRALDARIRAVGAGYLGFVLACRGDDRHARALLIEAGSVARQHRMVALEFVTTFGLAILEARVDLTAARALGIRLLESWERTEERHFVIPALRWFSTFYGRQAMPPETRACAEALSRLAAAARSAESLASVAHALGEAALLDGDAPSARRYFGRALDLLDPDDMPYQFAETQIRAAAADAALGARDDAVRRLTEVQRIARSLGAQILSAACSEARAVIDGDVTHGSADSMLTPRQREVLVLLVRGASNKAIARQLDLSPRTVEMHVSGVLAALSCRTRTEAATRAVELGLVAVDSPAGNAIP